MRLYEKFSYQKSCFIKFYVFSLLEIANYATGTFQDPEEFLDLILDVRSMYGSPSIFLFYSDDDSPDKDMELSATKFSMMTTFSEMGIISVIPKLSELSEVVEKYENDIVSPICVGIFTEKNSIETFEMVPKGLKMEFAKWLLIPARPNDCWTAPDKNPFNLNIITLMIVYCWEDGRLEQWSLNEGDEILIKQFATWNNDTGLIHSHDVHFDKYDNWNGIALNVAFDRFSVSFINGSFEGYYGKLFEMMRLALNFNIGDVYEEAHILIRDEPNGNYSGLLARVSSGEADIGLGFFGVSASRREMVDFTYPVLSSTVFIFIRDPKEKIIVWMSYFEAFESTLWLIILCTILVNSVAVCYIKRAREGKEMSFRTVPATFIDFWGIFCQQGTTETSKASAVKIILFVTFASSLVIYATYSAFFITYLTLERPSLPFFTLDGFIRDNSYQLISVENSALFNFLMSNREIIGGQLRKMMTSKFPKTTMEGFEMVCNQKIALYLSEMDYLLSKEKISCPLYMVDAEYEELAGFVLQRNSPYLPKINNAIRRLKMFGIMERLLNMQEYMKRYPGNYRITATEIDFKQIAPSLAVVFFGIAVAFAVMILEHVFYFIRKRIKF